MRLRTKYALALGFIGAVAMAAAAFGQGGEGGSPAPSPGAEAQQERQRGRRAGARQEGREKRCGAPRRAQAEMPRRRPRPLKRLVHGEVKVQRGEGFATMVTDAGEVTTVDHSSKTLTLRRADDETVTVTASDETRVCKDGHPAAFDAIGEGDLVRAVQVTAEGATRLRGIRAHSPPSAEQEQPEAESAPTAA